MATFYLFKWFNFLAKEGVILSIHLSLISPRDIQQEKNMFDFFMTHYILAV